MSAQELSRIVDLCAPPRIHSSSLNHAPNWQVPSRVCTRGSTERDSGCGGAREGGRCACHRGLHEATQYKGLQTTMSTST
eukprot:1146865-Pelagomonas_calceolata.AAC.5